MRDISQSLLRAQRDRSILGKNLLMSCVLTYGDNSYTYDKTLIKELAYNRQFWSHTTNLLLDDTAKTLHGLDLEGYKAVISLGLITRAGEEWIAQAPMWVIGQQGESYQGRLECALNLEGIWDRMGKQKADASYTPDSGDTRTVKDWLIEIITLGSSSSESEVTQETVNAEFPIHGDTCYYAGQRLTIPQRRVTKLAFKLKKVGNPTGEITFKIISVDSDNDMGSKVWGNAINLTTSYDWYEVTFDTPVFCTGTDQDVRIVLEFTGGDASNYVAMAYNDESAVGDEYLTWLYIGAWTDEATYDAGYKYSYSATPISVYDDYPAYGIVWDEEDGLIDTFVPADSFRINLNDSRLQKVKELFGFTSCVPVLGNDGLIHVKVPTTSGTTYDAEYSLVQGRDYHNFLSKKFRRRVVSPNYVIFKNHPSHSDVYSGYASDDSADLDEGSGSGSMKEIETHYVRATGNAECTSLATAYLSKLQMEDEKGSGIISFLHLGQEEYDYVNFVDTRAGDERAGNIGSISIFYKPGELFTHIGFGRTFAGAAFLRAASEFSFSGPQGITTAFLWGRILELADWFQQLEDIIKKLKLETIQTFLDLYEDAYFRRVTVSQETTLQGSLTIPSEAA